MESISCMRGVILENPRTLNPQLSSRIEAAVLHAMSLQPEGRYQSAGEFRKSLTPPPLPSRERDGVRVSPTEQVIVSSGMRTEPFPPLGGTAGNSRPIPWRLIGGAAALLLLLVLWWLVFGLGSLIVGSLGGRTATREALVETNQSQTALAAASENPFVPAVPSPKLSLIQTQESSLTQTAEIELTRTDRSQARQTAQAALLTSTAAAGVKQGMVLIPADEFQMGSERGRRDEQPVHVVYLDAFYMDIYEVTNARYAECVQAGACSEPGCDFHGNAGYDNHPVVCVDWSQGRAFCQSQGGDLPSEAQWEKAGRGGLEGKLYPWGDEAPVCEKGATNGAKFDDDAGCDHSGTEPVGSYAPNGYGLYDMAGNFWERVLDWYLDAFYSISPFENPMGPSVGDSRALRGGSWNDDMNYLRVTLRSYDNPVNRGNLVGFRCAYSP